MLLKYWTCHSHDHFAGGKVRSESYDLDKGQDGLMLVKQCHETHNLMMNVYDKMMVFVMKK